MIAQVIYAVGIVTAVAVAVVALTYVVLAGIGAAQAWPRVIVAAVAGLAITQAIGGNYVASVAFVIAAAGFNYWRVHGLRRKKAEWVI